MKIESSMVGMESVRTYSRSETRKFEFAEDFFGDFVEGNVAGDEEDSEEKQVGKMRGTGELFTIRVVTVEPERGVPLASKLRETCLEYLWRCLFGEKRKFDYKDIDEAGQSESENLQNAGAAGGLMPVDMPSFAPKRIHVSLEQRIREQETTQFTTKGTVRCEDGRTIDFNMNLLMSRSFESSLKISGTSEIQRMIDPLVINLKGNTASVSDMTFFFDLDADGKEEEISALSEGSGYLALDINGDGKINDGSELFGTKSGDGFGDLAKYDRDGNGWIDENDEVFDKLKIWSKDSYGNDVLYTLKEAGVGAIYLGKAATDFSITSGRSEDRSAMVRQTGVFLYENGLAGTIQHVDMTAYN